MVEKRAFGTDSAGREAEIFRISNSHGEYVEILTLGAAIHSVNVLDGFGRLGDVVLGAPTIDAVSGQSCEGITIGRVANVIVDSKYTYKGRTVELEKGGRIGFMHSGSGNWATKLFSGEVVGDNSVRLYYRDEGQGGFPCACDVYVTFSFDDDGALSLDYNVIPEGDTPISPTNHAYFNISGGDIRDLYLKIESDRIAVMEGHGPGEERRSVEGTPADFRELRKIGDAIASDDGTFFRNKDEPRYNVYFDRRERGFGKAAELWCEENGRRLTVYTDMPAIILFNAIYKETMVTKTGGPLPDYCAVCLEAQYMPNAVNLTTYDSPFYEKGQSFVSRTVYKFTHDRR